MQGLTNKFQVNTLLIGLAKPLPLPFFVKLVEMAKENILICDNLICDN